MSQPGQPPPARPAASPAVSVVIPAYQAAEFVEAAIASALGQSLGDIEVIVVDDCSTDRTFETILACADRDPRVVPLRQARRGGPAAARNAAMSRARGRWIAVLDADDLLLPWRLERMVAKAEALQADLLADNMLKVDFATGKRLGARFGVEAMRLDSPVPLAEAVRRDMPGSRATEEMFGFLQPIIRRDFLARAGLRYAEDIQVGEDFLLYFECIARGGRFHLIEEAGYVQRMRAGSHSCNRDAMLHLSAANRRMLRIARQAGDGTLTDLLLRRQRLIDIDCFALLLERAEYRAALRHAHCNTPARLLRHARAAGGALWRRLAARGMAAPPAAARDPARGAA